MLRILFLALTLVATSACAQSVRLNERQTDQSHVPDTDLPQDIQGIWFPYSESYLRFGQLVIEPGVLSWNSCVRTQYEVLRSSDEAHLIKLHRSESCRLIGESTYLILRVTTQRLEVSVCSDPLEFEKPTSKRSCSRGLLERYHR